MARLYAASLIAYRIGDQGIAVEVLPGVVTPETELHEFEAQGRALALCKRVFPPSEGYFNHGAPVMLVTDRHIQDAYQDYLNRVLEG